MDRRDDASPPNYYARLGVRPSASAEAIRTAYRKRARETHPDHNPDDPEAEERFRKVQEAYRVLRDPERREAYDAARARRRSPEVLTINREAPAGCGGYLWRVFAGLAAVAVFFVLEALGVWAAGTWTILLAVGGAALVAGLLAFVVADRVPDRASNVTLRLDPHRMTLRADGRTVLQVPWTKVETVRLRDGGWTMELGVDPTVANGVRPVPPVLTTVEHGSDRARLGLNLSDTGASREALLGFLRSADPIPFPSPSADTTAS